MHVTRNNCFESNKCRISPGGNKDALVRKNSSKVKNREKCHSLVQRTMSKIYRMMTKFMASDNMKD